MTHFWLRIYFGCPPKFEELRSDSPNNNHSYAVNIHKSSIFSIGICILMYLCIYIYNIFIYIYVYIYIYLSIYLSIHLYTYP